MPAVSAGEATEAAAPASAVAFGVVLLECRAEKLLDSALFEPAPLDSAPLDTAPLDTAPLDTASFDTAPFGTAVRAEPAAGSRLSRASAGRAGRAAFERALAGRGRLTEPDAALRFWLDPLRPLRAGGPSSGARASCRAPERLTGCATLRSPCACPGAVPVATAREPFRTFASVFPNVFGACPPACFPFPSARPALLPPAFFILAPVASAAGLPARRAGVAAVAADADAAPAAACCAGPRGRTGFRADGLPARTGTRSGAVGRGCLAVSLTRIESRKRMTRFGPRNPLWSGAREATSNV